MESFVSLSFTKFKVSVDKVINNRNNKNLSGFVRSHTELISVDF